MITLDAIVLPADLIWIDEFDWPPVEHARTRTLGGRQIVQHRTVYGGRPITLQGGIDAAWIDRATLQALRDKADTHSTMTLTLNSGASHSVLFNFSATPIEARPVIDYNTPDDADFYTLTVRFITA